MKTTSMHVETELISKAKKGDETAFYQLVQANKRQVRATVIGMLGDSAIADDVAQEVFIRFYKSLANFKGDAKLSSYLTRIAINLSLNEIKRQKRNRKWFSFLQKDEYTLQIEDKSANPEKQDTKDLVQQALQLLEPDFRTIVVLRMMEGYSTKETAEILQIPMGTVGSRLLRAQKKLKKILSKFLNS